MNEISPEVRIGTIGELLVQTRLLQRGVQAAAAIKDSGNDLIALRGPTIKEQVPPSRESRVATGDSLR